MNISSKYKHIFFWDDEETATAQKESETKEYNDEYDNDFFEDNDVLDGWW